jgi:hypothetical protein
MSILILADDTPTNSTYKLVSSAKNEMILRDSGSTLDEPRTFRVAHTISSKQNGSDRHLVQLVRVDDDTEGVPYTGLVHVVYEQPREGVTSANMKLEWQKLKNFVDANWDDIAGGFMPALT